MHIRSIIDDFENGALGTYSDDGSVGSMSEVVYTTYGTVLVHHGAGDTWCGGNDDPHRVDRNLDRYTGKGSLAATQRHLEGIGYHMTAFYASWNPPYSMPYDFTKKVPSTNFRRL